LSDQRAHSPIDIPLILASASPRRRELLESVGVSFSVLATDTDESCLENEQPTDFVVRLAKDKARAAQKLQPENVAILAADTIVVQDQTIFGKPTNFADAQRMWQTLSDSQHQVMTAVCLAVHDKLAVVTCITDVQFSVVSDAQMHAYWNSGEPADKAGGYAIQGLASAWVQLISGSYSNVVGLPLHEVNQLLKTIHKNWL